ncbi:MAG: AtpZ/AtpI family protein [Candidatus Lambdaproteobacteria bacterium]|nr:AtpZ/AtpI family protein [Candidatus Lambdaproteobacteria bacterium]
MKDLERLKASVQREIGTIRQAERDRSSWLAQTRYLGTLGLLIAVPVVAGAFLGVWLDRSFDSYGWTAALIGVGVVIGGVNAYLYVRRSP